MAELPPGTDLCKVPAGVPPEGHMPQFDADAPLATATIAVATVLTAISLFFTAGRIFVNIRKLKWADYFALIAFVLDCAYTGLILAMTKYARHQWDTPACWFDPTYMKILFVQGTILGPVIFFAKGAILLLYLQIFTIHKPMRVAVYIGLVLNFLIYWPSVPLEIAFAAPRPGQNWTTLLTSGLPEKLIYWGLVQGSLAVFIDLYIFVLPLPVLSKLHLSVRKRIGLCAIFLTALMGVVASVIALVYRVKLLHTKDTTWTQSNLFICIIVENNVAIIVSSVPAFTTLMKQHVAESGVFKSLTSKLYGSDSSRATHAYVSKENGSDRSLRNSGSLHGHNSGSGGAGGGYEFASYPSPVTQIHGGAQRFPGGGEYGKPQTGQVEHGDRGIVRTFDITYTQEVRPDYKV
ncbi:hypothetical protein O9K51_03357 [Purpureocillium lavendulum]|uniref:Rhodopsin domain-containing protein n=1 Tax=Purpureocillium lavendulum TaxID=1247861 RepID=A0AB34G025_9HYPO|nr:hypothetical protein O9K51_03357 [Purpureocillium lavendulum]